jgi:hypothetical protein
MNLFKRSNSDADKSVTNWKSSREVHRSKSSGNLGAETHTNKDGVSTKKETAAIPRMRRLPPNRAKSFDGAGSKSSKTRRGGSRPRLSRSNSKSSLGAKDIDEIYDFVKELKQTNLGESMLQDFVLKQSKELDASEDEVQVPRTIQIVEKRTRGTNAGSA